MPQPRHHDATNCQQPSGAAVGISELLACRQFEEEDREAIERVTMLLVEYAWSDDRMSDNAKKLKAAMLKVWEHWQARQANAAGQATAGKKSQPIEGYQA